MSLSWLISFLFFIGGLFIIGMTTKRSILKKSKNKASEQYWAREHAATFSRRKDLPPDSFITIDFAVYPIVDDEECQQIYNKLMLFKERPLINLREFSNVELKERYGTMQLEKLSYYEQNFIEYMNTSCKYGKLLLKKGYLSEAQEVLEYILSIGCDLSQVYLTLIDIYTTAQMDYNDILVHLKKLRELACTNMHSTPYLKKVILGIDKQIDYLT